VLQGDGAWHRHNNHNDDAHDDDDHHNANDDDDNNDDDDANNDDDDANDDDACAPGFTTVNGVVSLGTDQFVDLPAGVEAVSAYVYGDELLFNDIDLQLLNGGTGESLAVSENRDCSLEDVTARFCPDTASGLRLRVHLHAGLQSAYRLCYHALP